MSLQNQQPKIDLSQSEPYVCGDCDHDKFVVKFFLRRISPLLSPTGEEMIIPVQVFACASCGHVNEDFLPN